jgi:hypothetical protein
MTPRTRPSGISAGLRRVAVLTALSFGCATVRAPASAIGGTVPVRSGVPDPQLELWLESGKKISPQESEQATSEARAALQSAVARVAIPEGDTLLVVRAQGVARTSSRRTDQKAAMAGIVVGAVVVIAAVVVALVASKGKAGGGKSVARGAGGKPVAVPRVRPPPVGAPLPRPVPRGGPNVSVQVFAGVEVPPQREPPPGYVAYAPSDGWDRAAAPPPPPPAPEQELAAVTLPPPPPLDVDGRGFFDGDALRLELVVVDRRTGAPLWSKVVDGEVDPRDAQGVERLLYEAVADRGGWAPGLGNAEPAAMR